MNFTEKLARLFAENPKLAEIFNETPSRTDMGEMMLDDSHIIAICDRPLTIVSDGQRIVLSRRKLGELLQVLTCDHNGDSLSDEITVFVKAPDQPLLIEAKLGTEPIYFAIAPRAEWYDDTSLSHDQFLKNALRIKADFDARSGTVQILEYECKICEKTFPNSIDELEHHYLQFHKPK